METCSELWFVIVVLLFTTVIHLELIIFRVITDNFSFLDTPLIFLSILVSSDFETHQTLSFSVYLCFFYLCIQVWYDFCQHILPFASPLFAMSICTPVRMMHVHFSLFTEASCYYLQVIKVNTSKCYNDHG